MYILVYIYIVYYTSTCNTDTVDLIKTLYDRFTLLKLYWFSLSTFLQGAVYQLSQSHFPKINFTTKSSTDHSNLKIRELAKSFGICECHV